MQCHKSLIINVFRIQFSLFQALVAAITVDGDGDRDDGDRGDYDNEVRSQLFWWRGDMIQRAIASKQPFATWKGLKRWLAPFVP